ncbi:MAG: NADH-quinone oxidoreductase subunit M, partial [Rubrivivax sp.]|nr:NADH-quinone oxidoreductase subunit M [Rubrivivax sp.]
MGLLSVAIWLPVAFGVLLLAVGRDEHAGTARAVALVGAVASFLVTLPLITGFDNGTAAMQFVERLPWIARFNMFYHLGVDGLSLWFVPLTAFITVVVVIAAWEVVTERVAQYMGAFLILSGLMVGVFAALDGLLFYVFFEATLIPMYLIIGVWGGPRRVYAAFKFFLYTLLGSLLMLVALVYLYFKSGGSFDILTWHKLPLALPAQTLLFFAFLAAFSVKVPMWPVHTWLPDAHVEAPTAGSVILAGVLLKFGGYGFLRFSLPMFPEATVFFTPLVYTLSIVAVIYTSLVALAQEDMKKLIAYSSVAHMGFVTIGAFTLTVQGIEGAIFQMLSHGVVSAALFLIVGVVYDRMHTR